MRMKKLLCGMSLCVFLLAAIFLLPSYFQKPNDALPDEDEVGLAELQRFANKYGLTVADFEQPTIWVQLSTEAKEDPRGPCVTVCYTTKKDVCPKLTLLLYLTPRQGIIDMEAMVENPMREAVVEEQSPQAL